MNKVKKMEKMEMIIGAALAATSYNEIEGDKANKAVERELKSHFVTMCSMFVAEYYTDGDRNKASEFIAESAEKALNVCTRLVESGQGDGRKTLSVSSVSAEELKDILGEESFNKFKKAFKDND